MYCVLILILKPFDPSPLGEFSWQGTEPVPIQRVRGFAERLRGALGGCGANPVHLRQAEPGHRLRTGHERDRRADLLHLCHRP